MEYELFNNNNYEPLLLESINGIPFFKNLGGGEFSASVSEFNSECDAIGLNGYDIDFKCLISQSGAENIEDTRGVQYPARGIKIRVSSKASERGDDSLKFPNLWGFLVDKRIQLNEKFEFELSDKNYRCMNGSIKSLNKIVLKKKNILYFHPASLLLDDSTSGDIVKAVSNRIEEALCQISIARSHQATGWDTFYALILNNESIFFYKKDFESVGSIKLDTLDSWNELCRKYW
jgi:hypothetical protein